MDASARESMKDAAKCDKHCELQNFVIQLKSERNLHKKLLASCIHLSEPNFSLVLQHFSLWELLVATLAPCVRIGFSR